MRLLLLLCLVGCAQVLGVLERKDHCPQDKEIRKEYEIGSDCIVGADSEIFAAFDYMNFTFRSKAESETFFVNQYYNNCMIAGVKVDLQNNVYVSLPRWKPNVPATLAKVRLDTAMKEGNTFVNALLEPYPSWDMNTVGTVTALQSVLGFEIDADNIMWILDQGKVAGNTALSGAIKLVAWNITSNALVSSYSFPIDQASLSESFLNDVVIDPIQKVVYITDSGIPLVPDLETPLAGGLLLYDMVAKNSTRVLDRVASTEDDKGVWINIDGERVLSTMPMRTGADGIALSCDFARLFWCPLTSRTLYSIDTASLIAVLRQSKDKEDLKPNTVGYKLTASDGLAYSSDNSLYITGLETSAVHRVPPPGPITSLDYTQIQVFLQNESMIWPDTMGFDSQGYLYIVSNQLLRFVQDELEFSLEHVSVDQAQYRIWKANACAVSYLHGCTSGPTPLPSVTPLIPYYPVGPDEKRMDFIVGMIVLGVICLIVIVRLVIVEAKHRQKTVLQGNIDRQFDNNEYRYLADPNEA